MRPGPYERLVDDRVFDGLDALARGGRRARRRHGDARVRLGARAPGVDGAVCGPNRAAQLDPVLAARDARRSRRTTATASASFFS